MADIPQGWWKLVVPVVNGIVDLIFRSGRKSVSLYIFHVFRKNPHHRMKRELDSELRCKCYKMINGTRISATTFNLQKFTFPPKISGGLKWKIVFIYIVTEISGNFSKSGKQTPHLWVFLHWVEQVLARDIGCMNWFKITTFGFRL